MHTLLITLLFMLMHTLLIKVMHALQIALLLREALIYKKTVKKVTLCPFGDPPPLKKAKKGTFVV